MTNSVLTENLTDKIEFKPSVWRYCFWMALFQVVGTLIGVLPIAFLVSLLTGVFFLATPYFIKGLVVGYVIGIPLVLVISHKRGTIPRPGITISNVGISGLLSGQRKVVIVTIPFEKLDRSLSGKQTLSQKLNGLTYIVSTDGDKICISYLEFGKTKVHQILQSIGCAP